MTPEEMQKLAALATAAPSGGILSDQTGAPSSKRYGGMISLFGGILLVFGLGVFSMFKTAADSATVLTCGTTLCATGAALLGISVLEFFAPKK